MELALRIRLDRGRDVGDVGDVGREEGREGDREDTRTSAAAAVAAEVITSSGLTVRWGAGADIRVSSREDTGEIAVGEATYVPWRRSCAIPMNRRTCSSASSRFFAS